MKTSSRPIEISLSEEVTDLPLKVDDELPKEAIRKDEGCLLLGQQTDFLQGQKKKLIYKEGSEELLSNSEHVHQIDHAQTDLFVHRNEDVDEQNSLLFRQGSLFFLGYQGRHDGLFGIGYYSAGSLREKGSRVRRQL